MSEPLLAVGGLSKRFPVRRGLLQREVGSVRALAEVDLTVGSGECVALVGESGSGKSTLARCVMRLEDPDGGSIRLDGRDLLALSGETLRRARRDFQMVFQDPYASLNPRLRVGSVLAEVLAVHRLASRRERPARVRELLAQVGLSAEVADRLPHQLSGGQRQRVAIARALAPGPRLLVADEPVSALDVSVRAQVLNLLIDLQERLDLGLLLIAHDLALVERVAHRVVVLYLGRVVEEGPVAAVVQRPQHPYTVGLLAAVPSLDGRPEGALPRISGEPPSPLSPPPGCAFHPRCPRASERCRRERPSLAVASADPTPAGSPGHRVACHHPGGAVPVPDL